MPSVIGITRAGDIENGYKAVGCSFAIAFDDIINGNVSTQNNFFFIGINPLVTGLNGLKTNMGLVRNQLDSVRINNTSPGVLRSAYDTGTTLITSVRQVPTGVTDAAMPTLTYSPNFDGTAGTVNSGIPDIVGSSGGPGAGGGLINGTYTALSSINEAGLKTIGDAA